MNHLLKRTGAIVSPFICLALIGLASPSLAAAGPIISHAPRISSPPPKLEKGSGIANLGWASTNWSGYAITRNTYNEVSGTWVVPTVQTTKGTFFFYSPPTYSSTWIGIDGFNNSNLIQTGTEQDYYYGSAHYNAWWEILPAAETPITSMTVQPGDTMYADIRNQGNGQWLITIKDVTRNEVFSTTQNYNGPQTSAEWIEEAPTVNGRIATLANYGEVTLDPGTVNGGANPGLSDSDGGAMVNRTGTKQISTPSSPDGDTDGFKIAYGSTAPSAPTS